MKRIMVVLFIMVFVLSGCGTLIAARSFEVTRTVEWYKENPDERKAKLVVCRNDPGGKGYTNNCVNAEAAEEAVTGKPSKQPTNPLIEEQKKRAK